MTPFSGLSLIVHLLVIGIGKLIDLLKKKGKFYNFSFFKKINFDYLKMDFNMTRIAAIAIVVVFSSAMIFSFSVAVRTSIREGAKEPHIRYIRSGISYLLNDPRLNDFNSEWQDFVTDSFVFAFGVKRIQASIYGVSNVLFENDYLSQVNK